VLRDTIQPFPTFSEIYVDALKGLYSRITTARRGISQIPRPELPAQQPRQSERRRPFCL
jgi:hypothetical protein